MKISVQTFGFQNAIISGKLDSDTFLNELLEAGITGLETGTWACYPDMSAWESFRDKAIALGMGFPCLDCDVNLIGDGSEAALQNGLELTEKACEFAHTFSCPRVMLCATNAAPGMSREEGLKLYGHQAAKAGKIAVEKYGVSLCMEDYGIYPRFCANIDGCAKVLECAEGYLGFTFDNGNFIYGEDDPIQALHCLKDKIVHVHIKDLAYATETSRGCFPDASGRLIMDVQPGCGIAKPAECLQLLKSIGYQGWITCECSGTMGIAPKATAAFIRQNWK